CLLCDLFITFTLLFSLHIPPPPLPTLFPYTTLFRSQALEALCLEHRHYVSGVGRDCRKRRLPRRGLLRDRESLETGRRHVVQQRSEEHTSELQSRVDLVCRLLLEKKKNQQKHRRQND